MALHAANVDPLFSSAPGGGKGGKLPDTEKPYS